MSSFEEDNEHGAAQAQRHNAALDEALAASIPRADQLRHVPDDPVEYDAYAAERFRDAYGAGEQLVTLRVSDVVRLCNAEYKHGMASAKLVADAVAMLKAHPERATVERHTPLERAVLDAAKAYGDASREHTSRELRYAEHELHEAARAYAKSHPTPEQRAQQQQGDAGSGA